MILHKIFLNPFIVKPIFHGHLINKSCFRTQSRMHLKKQFTLKTKLRNRKMTKLSLNITNTILYGPLLKTPTQDEVSTNESKDTDLISSTNESKWKNTDHIPSTNESKWNNTDHISPKTLNASVEQSKTKYSYNNISANPNNNDDALRSQDDSDVSVRNKANSKYDIPSNFDIKDIGQCSLFDYKKITEAYLKDDKSDIASISIFEGGYKKIPSVRNILQETMPYERKIILEKWEKKMISNLGEEGFRVYKQGNLDTGQNFHECVELNLRGHDVSEEQLVGIENYWKSLKDVLPKVSVPRCLESRVVHPELHYQGKIDCVGFYKNSLVAIDFKTSSKPKVTLKSTYDDPLQLVAYIGALNRDPAYQLPNIESGMLAIAYSTGLPAHVHVLSRKECETYWRQWCIRLEQFWQKMSNS